MSTRGNANLIEPIRITNKANASKHSLTLIDAIAIIVGIVIGAGIFETPALVAANNNSEGMVLFSWLAGGVISLLGALCYAELSTTYPHVGGNYYYLKRAFGREIAFLFAWSRMTVIQTGSIVLLAFIFGDYASQLLRLGNFSASIYATLAIALLTIMNILGLQKGKWTQKWLTCAQILGLVLIIIIGLGFINPSSSGEPETVKTGGSWGLAMVFVLLSYGGWNEAAYISAEIRNGPRNMVRSLLWSIGIITLIYLLINIAYLQGLGLANMAQSQAVAADLMRRALGQPGAIFISVLVAICTLGGINATILTGARSNYALGQDFSQFSFLGRWQNRTSTPKSALLVQGAIALALVVLGTITRRGFETMVDYTAPVFWFFFLLTGISLFVLRVRDSKRFRPFAVPLYPLTPLLFCLTCGYLLYASLAYTHIGAIARVAIVGIGLLVLWWNYRHHE